MSTKGASAQASGFPLVSVLMNCHNSATYLREAIDSVYAQTYPNWEIVFIDNASTDNSAAIAHSFDSRLKYYRLPDKISLGAARNVGVEQCRGEFIAFLDCDDLWAPAKLEKQIPLFGDLDVGIVFSNCLLFNADGPIKRQFSSSRGYPTGYAFFDLLNRYSLPMPTVVIRAAALARLTEYFDPSFEVCEESDVFLRMARNCKVAVVDEVLARYRLHSTSGTWTKSEKFFEETILIEEKLRRTFPDDAAEISQRINGMKDMNRWGCAVWHWTCGRPRASREKLVSIDRYQLKHIVFFIATFVPYGWIRPVLRTLGKSTT